MVIEHGGAVSAYIFRVDLPNQRVDLLSCAPGAEQTRAWFQSAGELAAQASAGDAQATDDLQDGGRSYRLVASPLPGVEGGMVSVGVFSSEERARSAEATIAVIGAIASAYAARTTVGEADGQSQELAEAVDAAALAIGASSVPLGSRALIDRIGESFHADRVALGWLRGRSVRVEHMTHTDKIVRSTQAVTDLEAAMEECLDQGEPVIVPEPTDAAVVSRAAQTYSNGASALALTPWFAHDAVQAVLCVERTADRPFKAREIDTLDLIGQLVCPALSARRAESRWIGAAIATRTRRGLAMAIGPRHTWAKLTALLVLVFIVSALVFETTEYARGTIRLEAQQSTVVSAPFGSVLRKVHASPGDRVLEGQPIAELDVAQITLDRIAALAEASASSAESAKARGDGELAAARIAQAQSESASARAALLQLREDLATIRAPRAGILIGEDLVGLEGAAVREGDALGEVIEPMSLHAVLFVDESRMSQIALGQPVILRTATRPDAPLQGVTSWIAPETRLVGGRNAIEVWVDLAEPPAWLIPGMEGVGRIEVGRESYAEVWTRDAVNWLRLRLWW